MKTVPSSIEKSYFMARTGITQTSDWKTAYSYNPWLKLCNEPFVPRYIHPTLKNIFRYLYKSHPTRESLQYAIHLLEQDSPSCIKRALDIIQVILRLQVTDPNSSNFGTWYRYWEEHLIRKRNLDPNWADFMANYLLHIILYHHHQLPDAMATQIEQAILRAAQAIRCRDVQPYYTNISVQGTYVVVISAERYNNQELFEYGLRRLKTLHRHIVEDKGFAEYNSPPYIFLTLKILNKFRSQISHQYAKQLVEDLYHMAWQEVAYHFHAPTQQWAGPHSRSYSPLLNAEVSNFTQAITEAAASIEGQCLQGTGFGPPLLCPAEFRPYFAGLREARTQINYAMTEYGQRQKLITYLSPEFALGSVSHSDLWFQRNALIAYWQSNGRPSYLRLQCLRNGEDFAAAQLFSTQFEGLALAGISFATDIDYRNPYIDYDLTVQKPINDLRLRLELTGLVTQVNQPQQDMLQVCVDSLWINLSMVFARFGPYQGRWLISSHQSTTYLDWVFDTNDGQMPAVTQLKLAALGLRIQMSPTHQDPIHTTSQISSDSILSMEAGPLSLSFQTCPSEQAVLWESATA